MRAASCTLNRSEVINYNIHFVLAYKLFKGINYVSCTCTVVSGVCYTEYPK